MDRGTIVSRFAPARYLLSSWLGSAVYSYAAFLLRHRRIPMFGKTNLFNDFLLESRLAETDYVLRSFTSDKEYVKIFIKGVVGPELCVPTLAVLRSADEIDGYRFLPGTVVKPTHMSGQIIFVGEHGVDEAERKRMKLWLRQNYGIMTGERHYQRLTPKVIIEPKIEIDGVSLMEVKLHFFRGEPKVAGVYFGGDAHHPLHYLVPEWTYLDLGSKDYPEPSAEKIAALQSLFDSRDEALFARMVAIGAEIGKAFEYVRVDFYTDGKGKLLIGELTHISANAGERFALPANEQVFTRPGRVLPNAADPRAGFAAPKSAAVLPVIQG